MPNIPVLAPVGALFSLKFHQVAIYHANPESAIAFWEKAGYTDWHRDTATLTGSEHGRASKKIGRMFFNYDILPCELEYVHYDSPTRHAHDPRDGCVPFISHCSAYVSDINAEVRRVGKILGIEPYHRFITGQHHNPVVIGKNIRFREAIFGTGVLLGFDIKLIQKVPA